MQWEIKCWSFQGPRKIYLCKWHSKYWRGKLDESIFEVLNSRKKISSPVYLVLSEAMSVWEILNIFKILQQFLSRLGRFPPPFCDTTKHNWISLHQVAINDKNNTLKKSPKNNVFQADVKSSNLFVLLHICIIGQTRNSL